MQCTTALAICLVAFAPTAFAAPNDGTYSGTLQLIHGETPPCARTGTRRTMTIANNQLTYVHFGDMRFTPNIGADGSFSGRQFRSTGGGRGNGSYDLTGRVSNGQIVADLVNNQCTYHMTLSRT